MRKRMNEALLRKYIAEIISESSMSELNKSFAVSIQRVKEIAALVGGDLELAKKDLSAKAVILQHFLEQIKMNASGEMPEADDAADLLDLFLNNVNELLEKLESRPSFFGKEKYLREINSIKSSITAIAQEYFKAVKAYHKTTLPQV